MNKMKITALVGSALLLCAGQASAELTWIFDSSPNSGFTTVNSTTVSQTSGGVTATAQGWSNTGGDTCNTSNGTYCGSSSSATAESYTLDTAYITVYGGGIGTKNRDATSSSSYGDNSEGVDPEHALDNQQRYDSVLFNFGSNLIDLNSVTIGYSSGDSDITVLAYTGNSCTSGPCSSSLSGKTYSQLIGYGWELIGNYDNLVSNTAKSVNAGNVKSSMWLIGAYNPLFRNDNWTNGNDHMKLLALAGDKYVPCTPGTPGCGGGGVPEPGTLFLMGAGLIGLARYNKRRTQQA